MRTLRELHPDSVVIWDRSPAAGAVLAVPPLATIGVVTLASGLPRALPIAAAVGILILISVLIAAALPRARRFALTPSARLRFDTVDEGEDAPYRVLLLDGGRCVRLFEHLDPAVVLADVERLVGDRGIAVESAWGIPSDYFVSHPRQPSVALKPGRIDGPVSPTQTAVTRALFGAGGFVVIVFAWTALHARTVSALSVVLPLISVALVFAIGAWLRSRRSSIVISEDSVRAERWAFGRAREIFEIPTEDVLSAHVIGHAGRTPSHVLFETSKGSRVVSLAGDAGRRLVSHLVSVDSEARNPRKSSPSFAEVHTSGNRDPNGRRSPTPRATLSSSHSRKHPC